MYRQWDDQLYADKMTEDGMTYEDALSQACKGFAESDPTNDVDGIDAAYKMVILTKFAFGKRSMLLMWQTKASAA